MSQDGRPHAGGPVDTPPPGPDVGRGARPLGRLLRREVMGVGELLQSVQPEDAPLDVAAIALRIAAFALAISTPKATTAVLSRSWPSLLATPAPRCASQSRRDVLLRMIVSR